MPLPYDVIVHKVVQKMIHSELLGYSFWVDYDFDQVEAKTFMSAPTFETGTPDFANALPVADWEAFGDLENEQIQEIFKIFEKLTSW